MVHLSGTKYVYREMERKSEWDNIEKERERERDRERETRSADRRERDGLESICRMHVARNSHPSALTQLQRTRLDHSRTTDRQADRQTDTETDTNTHMLSCLLHKPVLWSCSACTYKQGAEHKPLCSEVDSPLDHTHSAWAEGPKRKAP